MSFRSFNAELIGFTLVLKQATLRILRGSSSNRLLRKLRLSGARAVLKIYCAFGAVFLCRKPPFLYKLICFFWHRYTGSILKRKKKDRDRDRQQRVFSKKLQTKSMIAALLKLKFKFCMSKLLKQNNRQPQRRDLKRVCDLIKSLLFWHSFSALILNCFFVFGLITFSMLFLNENRLKMAPKFYT